MRTNDKAAKHCSPDSSSSAKAFLLICLGVSMCALFFGRVVDACTGIRLKAGDGTVVFARTLEFGVDLESEVIVVPRGFARTGTTPDGRNGLKWSAKYASVGANAEGLPIRRVWLRASSIFRPLLAT